MMMRVRKPERLDVCLSEFAVGSVPKALGVTPTVIRLRMILTFSYRGRRRD